MIASRSRPLRAVTLAVFGSTVLALGCQRREIRYETEHLRIGTDFDEPLCRGDLDHLELVVTRIEAVVAADVSEPIEIHLWDDFTWDAEGLCSIKHALGCYDTNVGAIYSSLDAADHELVHGILHTVADPASFWDEGTAVALSERTRFALSAPVSNLELTPPNLDYGSAGMFSRWLLETRDAELYRELIRHRGGARAAFESVYGMTAEDAQDEYFETSPYSYGKMVACEHAELPEVGPREWAEAIEVDCDNEHVFGGPWGLTIARRVLVITERGYYAFSTSALALTIGRCQDEDLETAPNLDDPEVGDVPYMTASSPEFRQSFSGEEGPVSYDLAPGRYEISISQSGYEPRVHEVSVVADAGPLPQTPESTP